MKSRSKPRRRFTGIAVIVISSAVCITTPVLAGNQWVGNADSASTIWRLGIVGIGLNNPNAATKLHVKRTSDGNIGKFFGSSSGLNVTSGASSLMLSGRNGADNGYRDLELLVNGTSGSGVYLNASTNKVGIGTTSPSSKLHVSGGAVRADSFIVGTGPYGTIISGPYSGDVRIPGNLRLDNNLYINGSINNITNISASGNVTASGNLTSDTVVCNVVKIHNWKIEAPDFVFSDQYRLPPIQEVKTYTEKNKHLPDVPSAQEMKAKGVDIAQMNMTLLKKVEELTLYVAAQQKEIDELKTMVKKSN